MNQSSPYSESDNLVPLILACYDRLEGIAKVTLKKLQESEAREESLKKEIRDLVNELEDWRGSARRAHGRLADVRKAAG